MCVKVSKLSNEGVTDETDIRDAGFLGWLNNDRN